jgi:predicted metal-dependent phosphoesterase TrpH
MGIKADLHTHTRFSKDSLSHVEDVLAAAVKCGMGAIAITDHEEVEGALEAQKMARDAKMPLQVIVGEEVSTDEGDLLVYFVKKRIEPGGLAEVLEEAKKQGAICSAAHPYDAARHGIALDKLPSALLRQIGCIEAFNARVPLPSQNASALKFSLAHKKAILAGSDAHHESEIGKAYVEFEDVQTLDAFMLLHANRKIGGKRSSPFVRFYSRYAVLRKKLARLFPRAPGIK